MTRIEEALVLLSEECGEVVQAASKCIRFNDEKAWDRLKSEIADVLCLLNWLEENDLIHTYDLSARIEAKKQRLTQYSSLYEKRENE